MREMQAQSGRGDVVIREMYAPKGWATECVYAIADYEPANVNGCVRVLVQEIREGAPFKVGDRVRDLDGDVGNVLAVVHTSDGWQVVWDVDFRGHNDLSHSFMTEAANLTLVPPETSRLIRVTGEGKKPESASKHFASLGDTWGVRVEVVDER